MIGILSFIPTFLFCSVSICASGSALNNKALRILPLGDSITYGYASSDGNGYRETLYNLLTESNNQVDMIGTVKSGNMTDNDNEGHNGAVISEIAQYTGAYSLQPNVVLLHAGTNDMNIPVDPDTAPERLDSLISQLFKACPDTLILVAEIIPSRNETTQARIQVYNEKVEEIVDARRAKDEHVILVDMSSNFNPSSDMADDLHPNDQGYAKMGQTWFHYLSIASLAGWITTPVNV